jgi:hypothetical protein
MPQVAAAMRRADPGGMDSAPALSWRAAGGSNRTAAHNVVTIFVRTRTMRKIASSLLLLAFAGSVFAAEPQTIELKDGGKIIVEAKGTMIHLDAAGNRVKMRDGKVMTAKDGSKIMMKNNAIWKTITEHGTLKPGH